MATLNKHEDIKFLKVIFLLKTYQNIFIFFKNIIDFLPFDVLYSFISFDKFFINQCVKSVS